MYKVDQTLINKYLQGEATEQDIRMIYKWIDESEDNKREFIQYKKIWAITASEKVDVTSAWNSLKVASAKSNKTFKIGSVLRYAAVMLVMLGLGVVLQRVVFDINTKDQLVYNDATIIKVPEGQMVNVQLSDGTDVSLNSGSTFSYYPGLKDGKRIVNIAGEALFEVAHDSLHPFIVQTSDVDIQVFGTVFNVEAYPEGHSINTTLVEGSIGLLNKKGEMLTKLKPDENLIYYKKNKSFSVKKVNTSIYTSWKKGEITFKATPLAELAEKLEKWYNVEIQIRNQEKANEIYQGTILKNKPIIQILEILKLTAGIQYEVVRRPDQRDLIIWY
jgi:ferric-dicitrate binding protein FerR (iron transport regulator)